MCGITGFFSTQAANLRTVAAAMGARISHRGPDSEGYWCDEQLGLALGHRRLAILDLSPEGHQPMLSRSERFVLVFNGEIYNFSELKAELQGCGHNFRGGSDTEVMLAAFEQWGVLAALKRFAGMFAFALWDKKEKLLSLARDRIGEKPLYYGWNARNFYFTSELKALRAHPQFAPVVDRDCLALLMRNNYIPAPWSIYEGIYKLLPGAVLQVPLSALQTRPADFSPWPEEASAALKPLRYWSARDVYEQAALQPFSGDFTEALDELERLLRHTIKQEMISDVPLGAFLSGGVDSSAVVALMQAQSSVPVRTFSIGFYEGAFDEAPHARAVAKHLHTAHTELYVTPKDAIDVIPLLPAIYDEPFSDSSQIPTYLVSKMARQHVTVSLSGDGGDELFCGYPRFLWANQIWNTIGWVPSALRLPVAGLLTLPSESQWDKSFQAVSQWLPRSFSFRDPGHKTHKLAAVLQSSSPEALYEKLLTHWENSTSAVPGSKALSTIINQSAGWPQSADFMNRMMFIDLMSYLPDDIMVKVDRASMAVSLETRAPFLDHRIVEFVARIPVSMKVQGQETKHILRQLLFRHVPRELIERPKMGFAVPLAHWLRGPLRDWAEDLLSDERLKREGYFEPSLIRQKWTEHISEKRNWSYDLWDVLMFQAWLKEAR